MFRKDRNIHGGGVLIAVKNNLTASRELDLEREELESAWCKLQISGSKTLYNCCFYRKPDHHKEPIEHLDETIEDVTSNTNVPCIVVTGDFNLPHIDWDLEDCKSKYSVKENPQYGTAANQALLDLAHRNSLSQCVKEPTRGKNILDLVFTNNPDLIKNSEVIAGMSDHDIVITDLNLKIQPIKKKQRKVFFYKKANVEALKKVIQQSLNDLTSNAESDLSVEDEWSAFKATVTNAMSNHVPHKNISGRWNVPWMTAAIRRAIRKNNDSTIKLKDRNALKTGKSLSHSDLPLKTNSRNHNRVTSLICLNHQRRKTNRPWGKGFGRL